MVPLIMAGVSALGGVGNSIFGAIKARKARKKEERRLDNEQKDAQNLFNRDYYRDLTQKSDIQYLLGEMRKRQNEATDRVARTSAVTGKTGDAAAVQKQAAANAMAEATARIGAQNTMQKNQALNRYLNQSQNISRQRSNANMLSAQQGANAMQNGATMAFNAAQTAATSIWDKDNTKASSYTPHSVWNEPLDVPTKLPIKLR